MIVTVVIFVINKFVGKFPNMSSYGPHKQSGMLSFLFASQNIYTFVWVPLHQG